MTSGREATLPCPFFLDGVTMLRFSSLSYKAQRRVLIVGFLIVPIGLLIAFSYLPVTMMLRDSLTEWDGRSLDREFVGLQNYMRIFTRPDYFSVFRVSLYYLAGSFVQIILALVLATIMSFEMRGRGFFKAAIFFPYLLNGVAIGFIFLYFFRPDGTLDMVLELFGLGRYTQLWLGNPAIANISLASTSVWRFMGFNFIIFLGTIQSIPNELYDAAAIDGANRFQQFRRIILPSIKTIIELNLILSINGAISVFEIPFIMTGGANQTRTFVIQTVDTAFKFNRFGLASAMAIVLLAIVVTVTMVQRMLIPREETI